MPSHAGQTWSPRRALAGLLALLAALAAVAAAPSTGRAGTYTVYNCQNPTGAPAPVNAWSMVFTDPSKQTTDNTCPRGGLHIGFTAGQVQAPDADAEMHFWAPDDTTIINYTLWRSTTVASGSAYYFSPMERYGTEWRWAGTGCGGTTCTGLGNPSNPLDPSNRWDRRPPTPITGVMLYISCSEDNAGTTTCPGAHPEVDAWLHRSDITLADDLAPTFAARPNGALLDGTATVSGVSQVAMQAADKGGGLANAQVEVDGEVVGSSGFGGSWCRQPYVQRVPCPLTGSAVISVDTTTLADGPHTVRVLLHDAAGNTTAWGPVTATTHNAPPDTSCDPAPASAGGSAGMTAGLVRQAPGHRASHSTARLTTHYASRDTLRFSGGLTDGNGAPLAGAPVCVASRPLGSSAPLEPLARLTTGADGRFTLPLARGASRELVAIHRVPDGAVTATSTLRVIPKLTLHASRRSLRNGQTVRFSGRVGGGPIPARGVLLRIEAYDGTRWTLVSEVHARGAAGRFRASHRFRFTTGTQRYTFRAHIVTQAAYPYMGGVSRRIHVRVRG